MIFLPIGTAEKPRRQPLVTLGLILFTLAVNGVARLGGSPFAQVIDRWGYIPNEGTAFTFISSLFLHRELWLMGINLWLLFIFGPLLESRAGHIPFLLFYLGSGLATNALSGALELGSDRMMAHVGTSGCIAAVLGLFLILYPFADIKVWYAFFLLYWGFKVGVARVMGLLLILLWFLVHLFNLWLEHLSGNRYGDLLSQFGGFGFGVLAGVIGFGREGLLRETSFTD
jgi:membrane associated rhomboid family serine protease